MTLPWSTHQLWWCSVWLYYWQIKDSRWRLHCQIPLITCKRSLQAAIRGNWMLNKLGLFATNATGVSTYNSAIRIPNTNTSHYYPTNFTLIAHQPWPKPDVLMGCIWCWVTWLETPCASMDNWHLTWVAFIGALNIAKLVLSLWCFCVYCVHVTNDSVVYVDVWHQTFEVPCCVIWWQITLVTLNTSSLYANYDSINSL